MHALETLRGKALRVLRASKAPLRQKELSEKGVDGKTLRRLVEKGELVNPVRGVYVLSEEENAFNISLAVIGARGTDFVLCGRSAASYHGLVDRHDARLWLGMRKGIRVPSIEDGPKIIPVRWKKMFPYKADTVVEKDEGELDWFADDAIDENPDDQAETHFGVEYVDIHGVDVKVTTPERTVCDLIRFADRSVISDGRANLFSDERIAVEALSTLLERCEMRDLDDMARLLKCEDKLAPLLALARHQASDIAAPGMRGGIR